ncbi:hypothetical protein [Mycobacterium asiaticum]|uniref:hypothetical protein n=1 Tax=Mycobacterium asiaticum TaxID=1790 RepID=UPI000ABAE07F|nr:hypothetical protein [Mycobacterium asiaticum]
MTVSRRIAAAVVVVVWLAIGSAGTAFAAPALSGHYVATVTSASGETTDSDWYFTPCGDGCASVANAPGGPAFGNARLVNGQWTLVWHSDAFCPGGSRVPGVYVSYASWDPVTLEGKDDSGIDTPICGSGGRPPRVTQHLQLTQVG